MRPLMRYDGLCQGDAHTIVYDNGNGVTYTQNIKATEASERPELRRRGDQQS